MSWTTITNTTVATDDAVTTTITSLDSLPLSSGVKTSKDMLRTITGTIALTILKPARHTLHRINGTFLIASP